MGELTITQFKSANGSNPKQRDALRTLGLGRIGRSTKRADSVAIRGTIRQVEHLVKVKD